MISGYKFLFKLGVITKEPKTIFSERSCYLPRIRSVALHQSFVLFLEFVFYNGNMPYLIVTNFILIYGFFPIGYITSEDTVTCFGGNGSHNNSEIYLTWYSIRGDIETEIV